MGKQSVMNIKQHALDDQELQLVKGQRGKYLLVINGYTFAKNNVAENTTYWCCRTRTATKEACRARVMTHLKSNGLYKITITNRVHNHPPTHRMLKKIQYSQAEEQLEYKLAE